MEAGSPGNLQLAPVFAVRRLAYSGRRRACLGVMSAASRRWLRLDVLCLQSSGYGLPVPMPRVSCCMVDGAGGATARSVWRLGAHTIFRAVGRSGWMGRPNQHQSMADATLFCSAGPWQIQSAWNSGKNGLCCFSSPTVVRGPWPGHSTVSSGKDKI